MNDTMIEAMSQFEISRPVPALKRLAQRTLSKRWEFSPAE